MLKQINKMTILAAFAAMTLLSCKKNSSDTVTPGTDKPGTSDKGTWIVYNKDTKGWKGSIFALNAKPSGEVELSAGAGHQLAYSGGGRVYNNFIYKLNDDAMNRGIHRLQVDGSSKVQGMGFLATPNQSAMADGNFYISKAGKGYYWDQSMGGLKVQTFDPVSMQRTGEIDLSSLTKGQPYEAAGQLIIAEKEGKLFVDVQYGTPNGDWQLTPATNEVILAVIDEASKKLEGTTSYPNAANLGLFSDHPLWNVDAVTGDLYIVAVSNMKTQDPGSKILRIKKGQTSFDKDFELSVKDYQYPSDFQRLLAHNGKIYTTISSRPANYYGNGSHGISYRDDIWYWTEIDAATKKSKRLNVPVDNFTSYQQPFFADGRIYFISNNKGDGFSGVYELDPATGATKETFRLKNSGMLMGVNKLN